MSSIGDLAQTANEARLVQRHDLLALGDAGGRKAIAAQADVRRQSCCLAVARQRYGRDDGAEVVCHVVGHDNDGTGAVLDMAGCDRQICEPKLHRVNSDLLIHIVSFPAAQEAALPHKMQLKSAMQVGTRIALHYILEEVSFYHHSQNGDLRNGSEMDIILP